MTLYRKSKHEAALNIATPVGHSELAMDYAALPPEVNVLLLGDAEVGKSTFLS